MITSRPPPSFRFIFAEAEGGDAKVLVHAGEAADIGWISLWVRTREQRF